MRYPNYAQRLLILLGVDDLVVMLAHKRGRMPHNTKRGPGRRHLQGKPKDAQ
jgi:hypothetical protein